MASPSRMTEWEGGIQGLVSTHDPKFEVTYLLWQEEARFHLTQQIPHDALPFRIQWLSDGFNDSTTRMHCDQKSHPIMIMVGSFLPSLIGWFRTTKLYSGLRSRHCHGINMGVYDNSTLLRDPSMK